MTTPTVARLALCLSSLALSASAAAQPGPQDGDLATLAAAPQATPPVQPAPVVPAHDAGPESWLTFGALATSSANPTSPSGVRLQIDLFDAGGWAAGLGGSLLQRGDRVMGYSVPMASGTIYLAHANHLLGPLHLRLQVGVGGEVSTDASVTTTRASATASQQTASSKIIEAAALVSAHVGAHWAIVGGPVVQYAESPGTGYAPTTITGFVGLAHR